MTIPPSADVDILLVDDEAEVLESFELTLNYEGFTNTILCSDSRKVAAILQEYSNVGVVLLDLSMPGIGGRELLPMLTERHNQVPVIVVTATNELEIAVECMRAGAFDYLVKPVERMALIGSVRRAVERHMLTRENSALKHHLMSGELEQPECFEHIVTRNDRLINLFRYCEAVATSTEPVLITGETGVGKELIARALHKVSRRPGEFVAVNIAGLDDTTFSDMLFGHLRGAFTGAENRRDGLIRKAAGGTLFLDEIGDLGQPLQVKLLRLLQEREYYPLGADLPERTDVRVVCATNRDLADERQSPTFRRDLFYRLQTHHLRIPPLRDRLGDLPLLVDHFMRKAAEKLRKPAPHYPEELVALLACHRFPGNIRELEGMIVDAVSRHGARTLSLDTFRERILPDATGSGKNLPPTIADATIFAAFPDLPSLEKAGYHLVGEALKRTGGNQTLAARILGITQSALSQRLKKAKQGELANG